jgi:hypothetical protein
LIYLLDANALIDANRDYYPIDRVPEFWEWLVDAGTRGLVKIPIEIYEEIRDGHVKPDKETGRIDLLTRWAKESSVSDALLLKEDVNESLVSRVTNEGYAPDLTDDELEEIGRDPFLVAYALINPRERCVVTTEVSKPKKQRANRKLPDVCSSFGVISCTVYAFTKALDFKTNWNHDR